MQRGAREEQLADRLSPAPNALTIDVEDWYHPELVRNRLSAGEKRPQIEESTRLLLELLRERRVHATFFVVGELAQRHPGLIEAIAAEGHELGCHGMSHRPLWELTPDEFRLELQGFARTMAAVVPAAEITGFRAPTFSLDNRTRWALDILAEFGYYYDSSIFPLRNPVYGVNGCPLEPYRPSTKDVAKADESGKLLEFPMSVWQWAGLRVPVCGGFYLRALPFFWIQFCLRQIQRQRPFAVYVHPWETYARTPGDVSQHRRDDAAPDEVAGYVFICTYARRIAWDGELSNALVV
jgi:polysaccharide deacetylase family protein (PEP-CTERM system associated)